MSFHPDHGIDPPLAPPGEPVHWLVRPATVRGLWIGFGVVLAALVLGDFVIHPHAGFGIDGAFGFYAWYGLGTCVAMVLFAKGLGVVLKRPDTWYDGGGETTSAAEDSGGASHDAPAAAAPADPVDPVDSASEGAREGDRPDG